MLHVLPALSKAQILSVSSEMLLTIVQATRMQARCQMKCLLLNRKICIAGVNHALAADNSRSARSGRNMLAVGDKLQLLHKTCLKVF